MVLLGQLISAAVSQGLIYFATSWAQSYQPKILGLNPTNKNFLFRKIFCKNQKIVTPSNLSQKSEKLS
jgi:hypothetical protein